jgi:hypothetical protein
MAEAIVAGSKATADDRVEASKLPAYFWRDIVSSPNGGWSRLAYYWPVLDDTIRALGGRDAPCESILRRALDASDVNDVARSILVANLKAPTEADFQVLHEIWSRAIRPPVRTLELAVAGATKGTKARVRYNYRAVAAMMAFLQEERFEDLLRLWKSAPRDDPTLRVELVQALAQSNDPARVFPLAYEVEPGDGYWRIAEKFYGPAQGKHHQVIAKANGDASLVPGMSVKIPPPPDSPAAEALALAGK